MDLSWTKCGGGVWCQLATVNLGHSYFDKLDGVYIIWHAGQTPATVYVGQGNVRDRLTFHRTNPKVQAYSNLGLFVTSAPVPAGVRDGVEKYLANRLQPIVPERFPDAVPVEVNLPW